MQFNQFLHSIQEINTSLKESTAKAVNTHFTIRRLIGFYIVEFEQNSKERAKYEGKLLQNLASELKGKRLSITNLGLFKQFYLVYPIMQTVSGKIFNKTIK